MPDMPSYKAGYVTIAGKPNVGKSTLLNAILDFRLSKFASETTRRRIMGIMNQPGLQIIFLDTPGIIEAKYKFQQVMSRTIQTSVADADILLFIGEARKGTAEYRMDIGEEINLLKRINQQQKPVILAINKIDLIPKNQILLLLKYYSDQYPFSALVPISALKKDGLSDMTHELEKSIPYHPPFYDPDVLTEQPSFFYRIYLNNYFIFSKKFLIPLEVQITEFVEREKVRDLIQRSSMSSES
jgi:GTP-binding protein Era